MAKNNKGTKSRFFCTKCGKEGMPIQRRKGEEKVLKERRDI